MTSLLTRLQSYREEVVTGAFTAAVCVLLGAPVGFLWSALAPHAKVVITSDSPIPNYAEGLTEDLIAADGWFAGVVLVAGLLTGVLAWWLARGSGPFVVVALAVGGLLAALAAAKVGMLPGQAALQAAADAGRPGNFVANVNLQTNLAIVLWPVGALASFLTLVLSRPDEVH